MTDNVRPRSLLGAIALGAVVSTLASLALLGLWSVAFGPLMVAENPESSRLAPLAPGFVVVSCVVPAIVAGGIFAALRRVAPARARGTFVVLALVVLALSMVPVFKVPTDGAMTQLGLALMHVFAAAAITLPLLRSHQGGNKP